MNDTVSCSLLLNLNSSKLPLVLWHVMKCYVTHHSKPKQSLPFKACPPSLTCSTALRQLQYTCLMYNLQPPLVGWVTNSQPTTHLQDTFSDVMACYTSNRCQTLLYHTFTLEILYKIIHRVCWIAIFKFYRYCSDLPCE